MGVLTRDEILQAVVYDPESGEVLPKTGSKSYLRHGKLLVRLGKKTFQVKRLVWFLETGEWIKELIVHKNNVSSDCRFENLLCVKPFSEPPTREEVCRWYRYEDGNLISLVGYKKLKPEKVGGELSFYGYLRTSRLGREYLVHRLIYLLMTGEWPEQIDHIDGNKLNNKISNLRPADGVINGKNRKVRCDNSTGCNGVHLNKSTGRYRVVISVDKKFKSKGEFDTLEEAIAYRKELEKVHGYAEAHSRQE